MADNKPNSIELLDDGEEQLEDEGNNKLPSMGLRGSNRVVTNKSGGPFPADKFGAGIVNKQTTIAPIEGYKPKINDIV